MKRVVFDLLLFSIITCTFVACNNEDNDNVFYTEKADEIKSNYVSLSEALNIADEYYAKLDTTASPTRASYPRTVKSISYVSTLPSDKTRSANSAEEKINTTLYLVNYDGDKGFALLSSDRRLPAVYAISDEGSMEMSDTIDNKGLAIFMGAVKEDIANTDATNIVTEDTIRHEIEYTYTQYGLWKGPRYWGQGNPYNKYCFTVDGRQALVGCAAVSIAQAISYHSWPYTVDGETIAWRTVKKNPLRTEGLLRLLAKIGSREYLNMNYGVNASGALPSNYKRALTKLGFKDIGNFKVFSAELLENYYKTRPFNYVLTIAYDENMAGGHSWIIDRIIHECAYKGNTLIYKKPLFHCVWGWYGKANGYFYWGKFSGKPFLPDYGAEDTENQYHLNVNIQCLYEYEKDDSANPHI